MVDKRFLLFLFLLVSVGVHTHECFTIGRELFGIEKETPSGKNDNDKNKTTLTMKKTIINYENTAFQAQHLQKDKNSLIALLQKI